jgi:TolB-like protein/DNA-binding winged helix-turn-helix (wHTH) protein
MTPQNSKEKSTTYDFGSFRLDGTRRELLLDGQAVDVQRKVFDLLLYLARNRDRAVTKDELIEAVWPGMVVTDSVLTRAIMKARKAVQDDAERQAVIRTLHGHGYRFVAEVEPPAATAAPEPARVATPAGAPPAAASIPGPPAPAARGRRGTVRQLATGIALAVGVALVVVMLLGRLPQPGGPDAEFTAGARDVTLAVLPFANLSPDPAHEYFASGIQEEILNEIARRTGVRVIARTSVAQYAGTSKPVPVIAAELGVDHLVEGSIRYAEGRVRISTQLVDGATGVTRWSNIYDRDFADIFAIQSDVARRIAGALQASVADAAAEDAGSPERVLAYEEYLIARSLRDRVFTTGWAPVLEHVNRSLAHDPEFIPALWLLHNAYQNRIVGNSHEEALTEMRAITARAMHSDPAHPLTLGLRAKDAGFHWDWDTAMSFWERAIRADPTDAVTLGNAAFAALGAHDAERALALAAEGMRVDPANDWPRYAWMTGLRATGDLEAARHEAELITALGGGRAFPAAVTLALEAAGAGDRDAAGHWGDRLVEIAGPVLVPFVELLNGIAAGAPVDGELLRAITRDTPTPNANKWMVAQTFVALGDVDGAFATLDDIAASHAMYSVIRVLVDPAFEPLRADPRYRRFLARTGAERHAA